MGKNGKPRVVQFRRAGDEVDLTSREIEVSKCVIEGMTTEEIGRALGCSAKTVESHRANVGKKLRIRNAAQLTVELLRRGLVKVKGVKSV